VRSIHYNCPSFIWNGNFIAIICATFVNKMKMAKNSFIFFLAAKQEFYFVLVMGIVAQQKNFMSCKIKFNKKKC
jgi:hypothetical protein